MAYILQIEGQKTSRRLGGRKDAALDDQFLTVQEAAAYLKTTPTTISKWCRSGLLPAIKLGKVWRISRVELERRLASAAREWQGTSGPPG